MKKWMCMLPVAAIAVALALSGAVLSAQADGKAADDTIPERVYIGAVSVGGMTETQAKEAVTAYLSDLGDEKVTLKAGENEIKVAAKKLGISWADDSVVEEALLVGKTGNIISRYKESKDLEHENKVFPLALTADEAKTEAVLEKNKEKLGNEAVDFGLTREDGTFKVIDGKDGVELVMEDSIEAINTALSDGLDQGEVLELATKVSKPQGSAEELSQVKDELGTFHTDFSSSSSGRAANVKNACSLINGSVIYPGEEFSVYDTITPMDAEHGYELAGSYENGTTVQTYGGGVCQVSTTLYNAVIRAELEITERYAHSMLVNYVEPSSDAAIAGTSKNLKFKNSYDYPVYIEGYTSGGVLYFTVYGKETRDSNREVSFESETTGTKDPGTQFKATSAAIGSVSQVQSSHVGKTAQLWKVVKVNGKEVSREIFNKSSYSASPTIYEVGTSSGNKEAIAAIKAAISSNDLSTIKAAASKWANAKSDEELKKEEEEKKKAEEEAKKKADAKKPAADKTQDESKTDDTGSDSAKTDTSDSDTSKTDTSGTTAGDTTQ